MFSKNFATIKVYENGREEYLRPNLLPKYYDEGLLGTGVGGVHVNEKGFG